MPRAFGRENLSFPGRSFLLDCRNELKIVAKFIEVKTMKVKIILNPRAGRGKAAKLKAKILAELANYGYRSHLEETQWHGHAIEIAKKAVESGYDLVIAAGGDGTVNQVVNGMTGSKVPLGVLSAGTGNDFAAMIGMPADPAAAIRQIIEGETRWVDLCRLNDRYFISSVGAGFDGRVAYTANQGIRFVRGMPAYLLAVIKTLFSFRLHRVKMVVDGKEREYKALLFAVTNSSTYGGGIKITPDARIDDGLFDICVVKEVTPLEVLWFLPLAIKGEHGRLQDKVGFFRGREIYLESMTPLFYQIDGEVFQDTVFRFSMIPGGFPIRGAVFAPSVRHEEVATVKEA